MSNKTYSNDPQASKYQQPRKVDYGKYVPLAAATLLPIAAFGVIEGMDEFKHREKLNKLKNSQKRSSFKNTNKIKGVSSVRIRKIR